MVTVSLICLSIVAVLCLIGALHPAYDDNLLQRIGMGCICLSSIALMEHVYRYGGASSACSLMAIGMLMFALGVVLKVLKFRRKPWPETVVDDRNEVHP